MDGERERNEKINIESINLSPREVYSFPHSCLSQTRRSDEKANSLDLKCRFDCVQATRLLSLSNAHKTHLFAVI